MNILEAKPNNASGKFAVLSTQWNSFITDNLVQGALKAFAQSNIDDNNITLVKVPGAMELPIAAQRLASKQCYSAIIAIGCVIRGGTPHFDYVCAECTTGLGQVQRQYSLPITFGVLTVDNVEQAIERSSDNTENKGFEATNTALEMVNLFNLIDNNHA